MIINWALKTKIVERYGSQVDFAQTIKANETFVSKVVRGRRKLDTEKKIAWAKALGCKPKDIFANEDQNSK